MKNAATQLCKYVIILSILASCAFQTDNPSIPLTLSGGGHPPMALASEKLEPIYNVPINYEDPSYIHESETTVTPSGILTVKRWPPISFTYEVPEPKASLDDRQELAAEALAEVSRGYDAVRGSEGWFDVKTTDEGIDIIPAKFTNTSGQIEDFPPIMDTLITLPSEERGYAPSIAAITDALSLATGRTIVPGTMPMPLFWQYTAKLEANNEPARSVIKRLFTEIPVGYLSEPDAHGGRHPIPTTLSWQLYCIPPGPLLECALNVRIVAPEGKPTVGMGPALPAIPVK